MPFWNIDRCRARKLNRTQIRYTAITSSNGVRYDAAVSGHNFVSYLLQQQAYGASSDVLSI